MCKNSNFKKILFIKIWTFLKGKNGHLNNYKEKKNPPLTGF